jgi:hypothetical protein
MIDKEKVNDAYKNTIVLWDIMDLSDEERINVANKLKENMHDR